MTKQTLSEKSHCYQQGFTYYRNKMEVEKVENFLFPALPKIFP